MSEPVQDAGENSPSKAPQRQVSDEFYSLTCLGRKQLEKETAHWTRLSQAITQIVRLEGI